MYYYIIVTAMQQSLATKKQIKNNMSLTGHSSTHCPRISLNSLAASKSFNAIYVFTCKSAVKVTWKHSRNRHVPLQPLQFTQYLWHRMSHLEVLPVCGPPEDGLPGASSSSLGHLLFSSGCNAIQSPAAEKQFVTRDVDMMFCCDYRLFSLMTT